FANKAIRQTPCNSNADHDPTRPRKPITPLSIKTDAMIDGHGGQKHSLNLLKFGPTGYGELCWLFLRGGNFPDFDVIDALDDSWFQDSPVAVDHCRYSHVDRPAHRSTILNRSKSTDGQVLIMSTSSAPPTVVGDVHEEIDIGFALMVADILTGKIGIGVFKA